MSSAKFSPVVARSRQAGVPEKQGIMQKNSLRKSQVIPTD